MTIQFKKHLLSTYDVQGTLQDATKDTNNDETFLPPSIYESTVKVQTSILFFAENNTDQS